MEYNFLDLVIKIDHFSSIASKYYLSKNILITKYNDKRIPIKFCVLVKIKNFCSMI